MPPKKRASLSRATDKNRNKAAAKVKAAAAAAQPDLPAIIEPATLAVSLAGI